MLVVVFSLYGVGTGHARLGGSENPTFQPPSGCLTADEGGERTSNFIKPVALLGHRIAFGLTFTTPSGVRSTPGTRPPAGGGPPVTLLVVIVATWSSRYEFIERAL